MRVDAKRQAPLLARALNVVGCPRRNSARRCRPSCWGWLCLVGNTTPSKTATTEMDMYQPSGVVRWTARGTTQSARARLVGQTWSQAPQPMHFSG